MARSPEFDPVQFLVFRKFSIGIQNLADRFETDPSLASRMTEYAAQLKRLAPDELDLLVRGERQKHLEELNAKRAEEESKRFYNQPHAMADFNHWAKAEHWSLDEAIALVMGKAPEIVSWEKIKQYSVDSPFVKQYARLRDLAERAKVWGKLFDPVLPPIFFKWADVNEIAVPAELSEEVARLKGKFIDWKKQHDELQDQYDKLRSMYDQHVADWKEIVRQQSDLIDAKQREVEELKAELATTGQNLEAGSAKAQSPIERQNMLKAIYALAVKGYGYDPTGKRSTIVSEIVSDMTLEGLPLSEDTVRRYLKEARDNLADWKDQSR